MITRNFLPRYSCLSVRSTLFADNATKSPFQNALGKARRFLRGFFEGRSQLQPVINRRQHRLPIEFFENVNSSVASKFKFVSYRPGSIYKVTSRWCSNSLTGALRKDLLKKFYQGGSGPMICFVGFALAKKSSLLTAEEELEGVSYLIRDSFSSMPWMEQGLNIDKNTSLPTITLADINFGELIAKGCNAAIYSASLQQNDNNVVVRERKNDAIPEATNDLVNPKFFLHLEDNQNLTLINEKAGLKQVDKKSDEFFDSQFFVSHTEGDQRLRIDSCIRRNDANYHAETLHPYNIAIKVMFNYSAESNAFAIWNAMHKETLPAMSDFSFNDTWKHKTRKKKLKPHPNIVEMYSAFVDQLPLLPGAFNSYPQALPARLLNNGLGRNMTLFILMKRYHCSLKDFLKSQTPSSETMLLLFTQLLEALVHLFQNGIAHRDLKADNILLDLSHGTQSPKLVITDFGCCLENLYILYPSNDICKGGNMMLMAPEIVNSEPGPFSTIDYSRADLWAAGAIAYEIFGGSNPFYSSLMNASYDKKDLPPLPRNTHPVIQKLVMDMLHVNPNMRPGQNFAATVCQILLHAPSDLLNGEFEGGIHKKAFKWMFQMSSQTYVEASVQKEVNSVNLELRCTFCSRIQYLELVKALQYILEP